MSTHNPNRREDLDHHPQEPDEKVGVHAIDATNVFIVCFEYRNWPIEQLLEELSLDEWVGAFVLGGYICAWLEDGGEIGA